MPEDIKEFDLYPVLIEARLSKEGLLSFESILEEALVFLHGIRNELPGKML